MIVMTVIWTKHDVLEWGVKEFRVRYSYARDTSMLSFSLFYFMLSSLRFACAIVLFHRVCSSLLTLVQDRWESVFVTIRHCDS
jgi:hypothetical protein